jgi:hypothetical protein
MSHNDAYILGLVIGFLFIVFVIFLIPFIFYLITLQNTLKLIKDHNRLMPPGQVWLLLIPLFGTVWHFIVVERLSDSLKKELQERNIESTEERPAYKVGLTMNILFCCGLIPFLGGICSIAGFVLWIIYWVKIHEYKTKLLNDSIVTAA